MSDLLDGTAVSYAPSEVESRRFGVSVGRLVAPFDAEPTAALGDVRDALESAEEDVVVLRYPSAHVRWFADLLPIERDLIHADSMVHCEQRLADLPALPAGWPRDDLTLLSGDEVRDRVDLAALERLVPVVFEGYTNHYMANPLFDPQDVVAGYQEWIRTSLRQDHVVCVLDPAGDPQGFVTVGVGGTRGDLMLGGVAPAARRRHAYTALLITGGRVARDAGCELAGGPTQVQNVATQRVLAAAGYRPTYGISTVHAVRKGLLSRPRG